MPIDPEISLAAAKAVPPPPNLLGTVGSFANTINALNQNRLFQQEFTAQQRAGQIISQAPDLETGIKNMYADPQVAAFAGQLSAPIREALLAGAQTQQVQQTMAQSGWQGLLRTLTAGASDPSTLPGLIDGYTKTLSPYSQQVLGPALDSLKESLTQGLPTNDPAAASALFKQRLAGITASAGVSPAEFALANGTPTTIDVGGQIRPGLVSPVTGAFTPGGAPLTKTLSPQVVTAPTGPGGAIQMREVGGGAPSGATPPNALGASVPPPTSSPGVIAQGPSMAQQQYLTHRGGDMASYQKELDNTVSTGATIMQNIQEARSALDQFKPGGGANVYAKLAQTAQAFGAPQKLVDEISNGNLGASQEFNKLMVNTTMGQIKQQMQGVGESRLSQMEFAEFEKNNPNIDTDPRAIDKIFNFWTKLYDRNTEEQRDLNTYLDKGGNISDWPARWQQIMQQKGYITPSVTASGAPTSAASAAKRPPLSSFFK